VQKAEPTINESSVIINFCKRQTSQNEAEFIACLDSEWAKADVRVNKKKADTSYITSIYMTMTA
jgi:hypothetical protein